MPKLSSSGAGGSPTAAFWGGVKGLGLPGNFGFFPSYLARAKPALQGNSEGQFGGLRFEGVWVRGVRVESAHTQRNRILPHMIRPVGLPPNKQSRSHGIQTRKCNSKHLKPNHVSTS